MTLSVCTMSCRRSASTQPSAEVMPGKRGTSAHFSPISRISAPTCSAPPPPNGIATKRAGSWPRSIETSRIAPAMRASATRTIAAAAARRRRDRAASPTWVGDGASGRLDIERLQLAAERARRIDAAEHDLRIGQRRPRVALRRSRPVPAPSPRFPGRPAAARRDRPRRSSRRRRRWW